MFFITETIYVVENILLCVSAFFSVSTLCMQSVFWPPRIFIEVSTRFFWLFLPFFNFVKTNKV